MSILVTAPTPTITVTSVTPSVYTRTDYQPSVSDVAANLRARTKDDHSNELGEFTADTRPSYNQVVTLIGEAVAEIKMKVGDAIPSRLWTVARKAAVLNTCAAIERSYSPEQSAAREDSAYQLFKDDYNQLIEALVEAVADPVPGTRGVVAVPLTTTVADQDPWYPYETLIP